MIILKDVTKLINLETSYRTQLAKKGHVTRYDFSNILGISPAIKDTIEKAKRIASIDKPTLIVGESGTGKELFGYAEGAFTGARKGGRQGLFEMANRGTLFLDEIGEMSFETQAKLLRVLEEKEVMRLGSGEIVSVDVRIIAATNKNLKDLVRQGKFRADLFFRLNTITLHIPALRNRPGDIDYLTRCFMENESCGIKEMDESVHRFMNSYPWEGNVRELKNCVEFMVNISQDRIHMSHLPEYMLEEDASAEYSPGLPVTAVTSRLDHDVSIRILELLSQKNMGRRSLASNLREEGLAVSEYRLRTILEDLSQKGYILLSPGRRGASLTVEGSRILPILKP